jgi:diguanylate cyclase (GGDEF)-like protein
VAQVIAQQQRRADDLAARYGGEEFVLLLPGADGAAALQTAEHLLQALRALALPHLKARAAAIVTASVGVAALLPDRGADLSALTPVLLGTADAALYQAKAAGRDRALLAGVSHHEK